MRGWKGRRGSARKKEGEKIREEGRAGSKKSRRRRRKKKERKKEKGEWREEGREKGEKKRRVLKGCEREKNLFLLPTSPCSIVAIAADLYGARTARTPRTAPAFPSNPQVGGATPPRGSLASSQAASRRSPGPHAASRSTPSKQPLPGNLSPQVPLFQPLLAPQRSRPRCGGLRKKLSAEESRREGSTLESPSSPSQPPSPFFTYFVKSSRYSFKCFVIRKCSRTHS